MRRCALPITLVLACGVALAAEGQSPKATSNQADKRPTKIWTRTGPLGDTPQHVTDAFPLSDQENQGGWMKYDPMTDEFEGDKLDVAKWTVGMYWWKGRQPALFSEKNVTVSDGKLHLTMRKEKVPEEFEKRGYKDYTSAALHTKVDQAMATTRLRPSRWTPVAPVRSGSRWRMFPAG